MNDLLYKHVLFKDLIPYLKRTDYLEGFTSTEQAYIRKNIGAIGYDRIGEEISKALESIDPISHYDLNSLVVNKTLIPGKIYVISDFLTMYLSKLKNSTGKYITFGKDVNPSKKYKIVTRAITTDKLMSNVSIISEDYNSLFWIVLYDITPKTLDDGQKTMGEIIYLQDENRNEAGFDFKNKLTLFDNKFWHTFSDINGNDNSINCFNNDLCLASDIVIIGNCKDNKLKGSNIFILYPIINLQGEINNVKLNNFIDTDTEKKIIKKDNKYYVDYLDIETLTHLFYGIDNLFVTL